MRVKTPFFATDEQGNEVLIMEGAEITEVEDAGPVEDSNPVVAMRNGASGWNVTCRYTTPSWSEIITADAVKLLKAVE